MKGIEIDNKLINLEIKNFYNKPKRELIEGSFFDLPISDKYDFIIENPPYVRQELLDNGVNSKSIIKSYFLNRKSTIPSQSNLYVYFLLKSIKHLKNGGVMVAVIYDSWLFSSFGKFLKESFLKSGYLENIYHFKKCAFENIDVGATVIKFIKSNAKKKSTSYFAFNALNEIKKYAMTNKEPLYIAQQDLLSYSFNNKSSLKTNSSLFKSLKSISVKPIQRGTSGIANNYFVFSDKKYLEAVPIVKYISKIKTFSVDNKNAYILALNGTISEKTLKYLEFVKSEILSTTNEKYKAIKRDIKSRKDWYKIKIKFSGNFLFNYYMRKNIDFIFNRLMNPCSDNFYSININNCEMLYMAILNSTFTRISILNNSRNQGNGLRKIQLYEFKDVPIINAEKLSELSIKLLEELGTSLLNSNRYKKEQNKIIQQIDFILLKEYNKHTDSLLTIKELNDELKGYYK